MPDSFFLEFDKAGAEWVIVAYASGDPRMIDVIESGKSPHVVTGALISGITEELVEKEAKVVGKNTDPGLIEELRREGCPEVLSPEVFFLPRNMAIRQCGKKSNHGLNYIMGFREFSLFSELDEHSCKRVIHLYTKEAYVFVPLWWESIKRELKDNGRTVMNCFGDRRRFLDRWDNQLFKAAVAFIPQSTIARCVHKGLRGFWVDPSPDLKDFEFLANVHDSLLFQAPIPAKKKGWLDIASAVNKISEYMSPLLNYGGREFTVLTDLAIGLNWGEHSRDNQKGMLKVKITPDLDKLAKDLRITLENLHGQKSPA